MGFFLVELFVVTLSWLFNKDGNLLRSKDLEVYKCSRKNHLDSWLVYTSRDLDEEYGMLFINYYCNFHESFKQLQYNIPPFMLTIECNHPILMWCFPILSMWVWIVLLFFTLDFSWYFPAIQNMSNFYPQIHEWSTFKSSFSGCESFRVFFPTNLSWLQKSSEKKDWSNSWSTNRPAHQH